MEKLYLTANELAARWNMTSKTLRQWRWEKKGPKFYKINGRAAYRLEDIEKYEKSRKGKYIKKK